MDFLSTTDLQCWRKSKKGFASERYKPELLIKWPCLKEKKLKEYNIDNELSTYFLNTLLNAVPDAELNEYIKGRTTVSVDSNLSFLFGIH